MSYEIVALAPILLLICILILLRKPLFIAAPITFFYTLLLAITHWGIVKGYVFATILKALFVSLDIILIVFGAVLFLEYLKSAGLLKKIQDSIVSLSNDKRVLVIVVVWFFGSFIEGTAGFGTPAAITAPLLVAIGFPALLAVILALVGNSTAVVFGAVGTPFRVGFEGLDIFMVSETAGLVNLFAGLVVPFLLVGIITFYERKRLKYFFEIAPFALWSGLCFLIPYFLLSLVGYEFPSLLAPIVGLFLVVFSIKKKLFVPKNAELGRVVLRKDVVNAGSFSLKSFFPYFVLVLFLLLGKYFLPSYSLFIKEGVSHNLSLYNPGLIFLLAIFVSWFVLGIKFVNLNSSIVRTLKLLVYPFIAIFFITGVVQLLILSKFNEFMIPGMINYLASLFVSENFLLFSPFIGAFGAFLSGSATVSNLLFANFQLETSYLIGLSSFLVLALQVVGAGVGNMISLTNIVAAQTTVKLKGQEIEILKGTILPALIYLLFVVFVALVINFLIVRI